MSKTYRSDALGAIHETASDLHDAGLMDKRTLRKFDELCLTPVRPMQPDDIRALRKRERVSQAVFALHLNVSTGLISQWERGEKAPCRCLSQASDAGSEEGLGGGRLSRPEVRKKEHVWISCSPINARLPD